ncbi:MAG: folate-binding protein YgfZ [Acidimicrobiia bacterium]|nr:folate-binding protein YgfZ [Acidimicrobiia bacterium]
MTQLDLAGQLQLLREGAGAVRIERDVVRATGDAVLEFLQGQVSQDIESLVVGRSAWSFVLQPQGKVDVWFRITRIAPTAFVLDTDAGWGQALIARLERFRLRTPVEFELLDWSAIAVRGVAAPAPLAPPDTDDGIVVPVEQVGWTGWDVLGPAPGISEGATECSDEALEALRIEAGIPRMGSEIDESTIPAEAGVVPISVSFTKGCYTGQELVARIDSRGSKTPRRLVGLVVEGSEPPVPGSSIKLDGSDVGRVTSVAPMGSHGGPVALAYLVRAVDTPAEASVTGATDLVRATALALPIAMA